ncbi:MAG: CDP-alcohol phosphatidyltransferase family protein, partial [Gammaproteobacteria bacterium]
MRQLVMALTFSRIVAGPIILFVSIFLEMYFIALVLFLFAALTDFLDGKLARDFRVESNVGALLDPIADKFLLLFSLIAIILITKDIYVGFMSSIILGREIWIAGLREFAAKHGKEYATKVSSIAKLKTSIQFISISMFFISFGFN